MGRMDAELSERTHIVVPAVRVPRLPRRHIPHRVAGRHEQVVLPHCVLQYQQERVSMVAVEVAAYFEV